MLLTRKRLFILGLVTLIGFSGLGLGIIALFHNEPVEHTFTRGSDWHYQLLLGLELGGIASLNLLWMLKLPFLREPRDFFSNLIRDARVTVWDILFVSLAAGIGEEIFFRGAIQPFLGVWITAFLFVALHGYLNPFDMGMLVYGLLMLVVSALLGYWFERYGIYSAMTAHFLIDVVLFVKFRYWPEKNRGNEDS
jgi:membrane protease YdiL (CAAX protease family)